jgi:hypothetical protein
MEQKSKKLVYRLKPEVTDEDLQVLIDYGYLILEKRDVIDKIVTLPIECKLSQDLLVKRYEAEWFKEQFYKEHRKYYIKQYHLKYDKFGKVKHNKYFDKLICNWFFGIDREKSTTYNCLYFRTIDFNDSAFFYAAETLDEFFFKETNELRNLGFIELLDYNELCQEE